MISHEIRSRKVTMGFKPSLYKKFQKIAHIQNVSPTQIVTVYMEKYVKEHQADLEIYDSLYPDEKE